MLFGRAAFTYIFFDVTLSKRRCQSQSIKNNAKFLLMRINPFSLEFFKANVKSIMQYNASNAILFKSELHFHLDHTLKSHLYIFLSQTHSFRSNTLFSNILYCIASPQKIM